MAEGDAMKNKLAAAAIVAVLLAMAGCAVMKSPDYVAPTTGPTARVTFRNLMDESVSMTLYENAARCSRRRASPLIAASLDRTLVVVAGQPLALTSNYVSTKKRVSCNVTISFDVRAATSVALNANRADIMSVTASTMSVGAAAMSS